MPTKRIPPKRIPPDTLGGTNVRDYLQLIIKEGQSAIIQT